MDAATVEWIASHRGELPSASGPSLRLPWVGVDVLAAAPLPESWHAEAKVIESIHGTRHLMRTAALAGLLAVLHRLAARDTATLVVAAAVHDCRRVNDKDDAGHGERGAAWLTKHSAEAFGAFGIDNDSERVRQAATPRVGCR